MTDFRKDDNSIDKEEPEWLTAWEWVEGYEVPSCSNHTLPDIEFKKDSKDNPFTKPLLEELVPEFILMMGDILAGGGNEYGYQNWQKCPPEERHHYVGAMLRHAFQSDFDDSEDHLAAVAINAMFLWYFKNKKK